MESLRPALGEKTGEVVSGRNGNPHELRRVTGMRCPVCEFDLLMNVGDVAENKDGSCEVVCMKCNAPIRANSNGFAFLNTARSEFVFDRSN